MNYFKLLFMNEKETFYARYDAYPEDCGYNYYAKWRGMYIYAKSKHALDACIKEQKLIIYGGLVGGGVIMSIFAILVIPTSILMIKENFTLFYVCIVLSIIAMLLCRIASYHCKKLHQEFKDQVIHLPIDV